MVLRHLVYVLVDDHAPGFPDLDETVPCIGEAKVNGRTRYAPIKLATLATEPTGEGPTFSLASI